MSTTESKTASRCLGCGKAAPLNCARCRGTYCGPACQKAHWPAHKAHCKILRGLRADGIAPTVSAELASLLANPAAEPYDGPKGRGLRALRDIPAGSCVGYIVGREVGGDAGVQSVREYSYLWETIVGDVAGERVLPEEVNASLMNDRMSPEVFAALVTQGPLEFIRSYEMKLDAVDVIFDEMPRVPGATWGAYRARAVRDVPAGTPLETFYGPTYWLNMLASGTLPGTTFEVAWEANHVIARGRPEFHDAIVLNALGRPAKDADEREFILASTQLGGIPVWLRFEGVEVLYGGIGGESYFPADPDHKVVVETKTPGYILAPWTKGLRKLTGASREVINVATFYAGLIGTALQARGLVRQLLAEAPEDARLAAIRTITAAITETTRGTRVGVPPASLAQLIVLAPDEVDGLVEVWLEKSGIPR
jgi:hypothetical protein